MIRPHDHPKEEQRLKELESYSILDSLPEKDYDNITAIAAEICGTPISLVSLVDDKRQWFKSHHGLDATETPKEYAFCAHAINQADSIFVVEDSRKDQRFHDNPIVTGDPKVIFYAGVPLVSENGLPLGTLCVIDHKPKSLTRGQIQSMEALSHQVMNLLALRKKGAQLEGVLEELEEKNQELERFAFIAAHDLKSPLNSMSGLINVFLNEHGKNIDTEGKEILGFVESSANKLKKMIDGLLEYSKSENILKEGKSNVKPSELKEGILGLFGHDDPLTIDLSSTVEELYVHRAALEQILINLVSNAIKYNDKEHAEINIELTKNSTHYEFSVTDNGPGIPPEFVDRVFNMFEVLTQKDKFGETGNGIGLATVRKMVRKMGGSIKVQSKEGEGASFIFTIKK
ncbi:MAG: GAF domain-containing sensor histidine kinase [Cyclobacteriaceae bacterium]